MLRRLLCLGLLLCPVWVASGAATIPDGYARVDVAPAKTSIYVGTVSMTMPTFVRHDATFEAAYTAKVFPFFFYNEEGTLDVQITDAQLDDLSHGRPVQFAGEAVRNDGAKRRVEGTATPADAKSGALKVRVIYSKHLELIFHTTYRFSGDAAK